MLQRPTSRRRQRNEQRERRRLAQRDYRRRLDAGRYMVDVEVGADTVEMLVANDWLGPDERDDREKVAEALNAMVAEASRK